MGTNETVAVTAPMLATVATIEAPVGARVRAGQVIAVLEAMKMEHEIISPVAGVILSASLEIGATVDEGAVLFTLDAADVVESESTSSHVVDLDVIRPDLQEVLDRHAFGFDENRPEAVAKRRGTNQRTARENLADLVDQGSFIEYAPLVVAAQRRRRSEEDLIRRTPADGLLAGIGTVNAATFGADAAQCAIASYDYTVLAGTQGSQNHRKKDRLFELVHRTRLPLVLFAEGGGGRPGDTDGLGIAGLDGPAFALFGQLSGRVPLVGITSGFCFAGNAALLGCCDVVIATKGSNIGMGGPAMIEGGGLGVHAPTDVGPVDMQYANGVVDLLVDDEAAAVAAAKKYLSYFQGTTADWACADQRTLRHAIPENRLRVYDIRTVIEALADTDSVLELRRGFAPGMVTAFARIEGRPIGLLANDPTHLGGAIDAEAADKGARFLQLCDAFDLPIVFLCDTPGFMVGPDAETRMLVRKAGRLFVTGGSLTVPFCTVILRKGYGLGAMAMAGGGFRSPLFSVAWPTGEVGGMGLEGAVRLGYRDELAAIEDPEEREKSFQERVAKMYQHGKALSAASHFEFDEVIDPADTRRWITTAFRTSTVRHWRDREHAKRPMVDTW